MSEEVTVLYLHVENGIVVNRVLGSTTYKLDDWVPEVEGPSSVHTAIGSKYSELHNTFLPPGMSDEEATNIINEYSTKLESVLQDRIEYSKTEHFKQSLAEPIKNDIIRQIEELTLLKSNAQKNPVWFLLNNEKRDIIFHEPLNIKPNLENEV